MLNAHDQLEIKRFCFQYLARREHSQLELRQKLSRKGFEQSAIKAVLDDLVSGDWQSDYRFADSFFRQCIAKGYGPVRIAYELKQRGITDGQMMLNETEVNWEEQLIEVYQKKFGENIQLTAREWAKRLRFLHYRGFTTEMIRNLSKALGLVIK